MLRRNFIVFFSLISVCVVHLLPLDHTFTQISPEMLKELRDFIELVPQKTYEELIAKHYAFDKKFRKSANFVHSSEAHDLLKRAEGTSSINNIIEFLHLNIENSTVVIETRPSQTIQATSSPLNESFEIVLLATTAPKPEPLDNHIYVNNVGSTTSFVNDLIAHVSHGQLTQMVNEKRAKNAQFAKFYAALRDSQLRPMINAALAASDLSAIIAELKANFIYPDELVPIAFEVISWGPAP